MDGGGGAINLFGTKGGKQGRKKENFSSGLWARRTGNHATGATPPHPPPPPSPPTQKEQKKPFELGAKKVPPDQHRGILSETAKAVLRGKENRWPPKKVCGTSETEGSRTFREKKRKKEVAHKVRGGKENSRNERKGYV